MRRTASTSFVRALALGVAICVAAPTAALAAPSSFTDADAEALYGEGIQRFDEGDFEAALEKLEASLAMEQTTVALYAKAQSLNKLERCREAVPIYKDILTQLPADSSAVPAVKDALVTCADKMSREDDRPIVAPVVESDPDDDEPLDDANDEVDQPQGKPGKRWFKDPYAPILIGVGAVGVGVGGYYLVEASKENARQPEQYDEFAAKGDRVRKLRIQGGVILGIGGALLLTGVIRYAILGARDRRSRTAVAPSIGPRWSGLSITGQF